MSTPKTDAAVKEMGFCTENGCLRTEALIEACAALERENVELRAALKEVLNASELPSMAQSLRDVALGDARFVLAKTEAA